ncbi:MAG: methionyl-tRNA formyltransferase, partial [Campylobacteraceae bacterium]|nr:methionyl-tRNA formyltransferase [Campylobacteraceae bacterium]
DKAVGRKQILTPPHIKNWALENDIDIKISQPKTLKEKDIQEEIMSCKPDFIIVAAYGQILPKKILNICPCINLHASILPKYRGASPIQTCILKNDEFTGVSAMLMEEGLDSGDILALRFIEVKEKKVELLFDELAKAAAKLTIEVLKNFDILKPIKQFDGNATYCVKIKKNNGLFSFDESAAEIYQKYLAYTPWPGIFLQNGLKIKGMKLINKTLKHTEIGVIKEINAKSITISCSLGSLEIISLQAPSKKEIGSVEYIRGKRLEIGSKLV